VAAEGRARDSGSGLNDFSATGVKHVQFLSGCPMFLAELTGDQSMATSLYGKSATILKFPASVSRKAEERRSEAQRKPDLAPSDVCAAVDGCWYHEEALVDETKH